MSEKYHNQECHTPQEKSYRTLDQQLQQCFITCLEYQH